jgi:uncharacterized delta-60 repeat protein
MKKIFLLSLFCLFKCLDSEAQHLYGLDLGFASNGIYYGDTGGYARIVVQPDKKILVSGTEDSNTSYIYMLRRFNEDGSIDGSFAYNGRFRPDALGFTSVSTLPVCLQQDGKILFGGSADRDFLLIRLKQQDGSLDSSFGNNGISRLQGLAGSEQIRSLTLQPDGKIVAYGQGQWFGRPALVVARFQSNGSIDSSFGVNGVIWGEWSNWGIEYPTPNDVAITPDGKIVLGAVANIIAIGTRAFLAVRLLSDGSLDTSFNHTGLAYTLPGLVYCKAMCLQQDGKVLLTGYTDSMVVVRFDTSGQLDNSFGNRGITKIAEGDAGTIELQSDGKILLGGDNDTGALVYRLLPNGGIDNSFSVQGALHTSFVRTISDIALQQDGKLLATGVRSVKPPNSFTYYEAFIARFYPNATTTVDVKDNEDVVSVYPNPAVDHVYFKSLSSLRLSQVILYSPDGKLLLTQTYPQNDRLSVGHLPNGLYYLVLTFSDNQQHVRKLVIQK